jgi:epsilon-lactone hydrolase
LASQSGFVLDERGELMAASEGLEGVVVTHPLDADDASIVDRIRTATRPQKGLPWRIETRRQYDALMESVPPRDDVTFEPGTVGGVPGLWVQPGSSRSGEAILHFHGGWFHAGSAWGYRHLVGHIAARAGASAFVPDYRLAPEHPFPAAVDDALATFRGMNASGIHRIAVTGDSAGGNLALVLASNVAAKATLAKPLLVGSVAFSPVTDLTLSGASYETRAAAEFYFTKQQVAELVRSYLGTADANDPLASPLQGCLSGVPPIRVHVGDDEVLLDDARRYVDRAVADGVDARLDVWTGMPHGFVAIIGGVKAAAQALDASGLFLAEILQAAHSTLHGSSRS